MYGNYVELCNLLTVQEVVEPPPRQTKRQAAYRRGYAKVRYVSDVRLVLINRLSYYASFAFLVALAEVFSS